MFGKLGLGHFIFSVVSVVVGVLCFLYWDDDSGLWQQGHGWEVWMHVVCGIFYFVPGIFGCLVQKKKNNSMVNICMTTAFYAMVLTAVQILFSTYTIVSAVSSTMIMISVSLIIIAVLEFIICVFTIVTCGKALKDLHKAKMTRSRSRSSFCSRYHPAARFNPIAIETLSDERYPAAGRSLVDPGTRQLSYSTTNIAPSKAKVTTSPTGVRKQTRFSSTPNLTFPDPPSEPPPPLEMEPPDLTSRAELMLASHVKSSQSRSSSGHIRSSTPDVAPSRESSLHRNSYREMRREQSLRNQIKSDISRETAPTNNQPSGYDHRRLNVQVNSSRDHLQPIELAESGADDIWIMRPDAKRSSRSPTQDKQDATPDYRREVRIDPRQYQVQGNLNKLNVAKPTNLLEGSGEKPPPIPPRDPINIRRDSKVDTFDNHSRLQMAQGYHQLIERAPPTTFVADRQQESPCRHHNSDYHQQDNYRANQRLPSSEFSALPYNKSRDAININENIWRGSDPPDIDYRPHQSWHSHLQNHPSREERVKQDSRSPSKSQMKHHQKQTPADKQTPQNDNDRRRERSRNESRKRNIPYTEKQHQRTDNNNSQVREALSEYVKNQYRNKDYKTAKDRYREESAQYNADERRRSQDHRIHKNPVKEPKPARLPALSEKPKQTQSIANDAYMTQSSNNPEHQKDMIFKGQHEKYGPTKRQYKSADDLYEDNALPGFQVKLRVRDNEGTLGDEIFYYSSTSLFQEETDI